MFDHLDQQPWRWTAADQSLSNTMADDWVRFARAGDPNGRGQPAWPAFVDGQERVMMFGDTIEAGVLPNGAALDAFDAVYSSIRQPRP